jgi:hypothetical protein
MNPGVLADTGILVAVPLNRDEFEERVHSSDWLGKFRPPDAGPEAVRAAIDNRWRDTYSPLVAEPVLETVWFAQSAGADVQTRATLADLARLTATKRVVILFGHWKGPEIVFDDLLPGWTVNRFVELAAMSQTPIAQWITSRLGNRAGTKSGSGAVLDALNDALNFGMDGVRDGIQSVLEHEVTRHARRREELQTLFSPVLRPGNRLELFDGLHSREVVEAAIAKDFEGVLDLTACTSTVLADYIAVRRRHRLRTVQFPVLVEFIYAAKAVAGTLQLTATGNFEYLEARDTVTKLFERAIGEHAKEMR